jgi:hypothetical protein
MTKEEFKARWDGDDNGGGINFDDIRMAVLCQRVVPAQVRGRCSC